MPPDQSAIIGFVGGHEASNAFVSAPPSIGLKAGLTRALLNSISQAATPRISPIPKIAASSPRPPAITMSCTAGLAITPVSMPSRAGEKARAVR